MGARGLDAERGRLQRAAYGRHATDADREALAAFERREAAAPPRASAAGRVVDATAPGRIAPPPAASWPSGPARPAVTGPGTGGSAVIEPPGIPASSATRRFGLRAVLAGVAAGLLLGAAGAMAIGSSTSRDALDVFTAAPSEPPRDSAADAFGLFVQDLDVRSALPIAGPVLLATTERWQVYGFLSADAEAAGGQRVCLGVVPTRPSRDAGSGTSCAERADFERTGLRISVSAPGTGDIGAEAVWSPDGGIELTEG